VLEKELNQLKLRVYFTLPEKIRSSLYPQEAIRKGVREVRDKIWQDRYAKRVARVS
jgi:hypothetical protein